MKLAFAAALFAAAFPGAGAGQTCSIKGRAVNALTGEPLKKARVTVVKVGDPNSAYSDFTIANGVFCFANLPSAQYTLTGEKPGFLAQRYGEAYPEDTGKPLKLKPPETLTVTLPLTPEAVITGQVADQDGDPISGAAVVAFERTWAGSKRTLTGAAHATSDDEGQFRIGSLRGGRYVIGALDIKPASANTDATESTSFVRTYYPSALSPERASTITIHPGQTISSVTITVQSVSAHHVRGTLSESLAGATGGIQMLALVPVDFEQSTANPAVEVLSERSFDIANVTPGRYTLALLSPSENDASLKTFTEVTVGDSDVDGIELTPLKTFSISGRLTSPMDPSIDLSNLTLHLHSDFDLSVTNTHKSDGTLTFDGLIPGDYDIVLPGLPPGYYVKSAQFGPQDVLDSPLKLTGPTNTELRIAIGHGTAGVQGKILLPPAPTPDATSYRVLLIPAQKDDFNRFALTSPEPDGMYSFTDLRAGRYRLLAVPATSVPKLKAPPLVKALAAQLPEIDLHENDHKQLDLTPTAEAQIDQTSSRLGLTD